MRTVLASDGVIEIFIGVGLIVAALGSPADGFTMATPASRLVIIALGILLLLIGLAFLALSHRLTAERRRRAGQVMNLLASVNAASAVVVSI